ncbi:hypothetical protein GCM10010211_22890 [Streptomyces albospinus]|uniref:Uncharacterized protein n=1 Tax=Streptomyces albospinus TaxID=285515 RepID=A0ABQ2UY81_9ACTN|nr:hypothetical protein GCM10010211_22890 [Streptomyces albospinus]
MSVAAIRRAGVSSLRDRREEVDGGALMVGQVAYTAGESGRGGVDGARQRVEVHAHVRTVASFAIPAPSLSWFRLCLRLRLDSATPSTPSPSRPHRHLDSVAISTRSPSRLGRRLDSSVEWNQGAALR